MRASFYFCSQIELVETEEKACCMQCPFCYLVSVCVYVCVCVYLVNV